eukprot:TRINITY_DN17496_c0_g1_i1.p1 TRINITY_DN17496_c0_g1~~TRINITY_DN17496_c0_g1_i1.p1  ORF type:complete len:1163 (+),score=199.91 TRINITY_DN17496_c0_g1_i1:73-3489(+)
MKQQISYVHVPILESPEAVEVPVGAGLPVDHEEVLEILRAEEAPLSLWLDFSKAYLLQQYDKQGLEILREGSSQQVAMYFGEIFKSEQSCGNCFRADYYLQSGVCTTDRSLKTEFFKKAQELITQARQATPEEQLPWLCQGRLSLAKGDIKNARKELEKAVGQKNNGKTNVLGHLAMAGLEFYEQHYQEALGWFKKAIAQHPRCPPNAYIGLAHCYYKLGEFNLASKSLERVIQLDPKDADALLALAVIRFNRGDPDQGYREGLELLYRAFESDPCNPCVLNELSRQALLVNDLDGVQKLAHLAFENAMSDRVRAESCSLLARAHHASGDINSASKSYTQASRFDASLPLPHYGLAQMYYSQGEAKNAISELEKVLEARPGCEDALNLLAQIHPSLPQKIEKVVQHFKEAAHKNPERPDIQEMLGRVLLTIDLGGALTAFEQALQIYRKRDEPVPPSLLCNTGYLLQRAQHIKGHAERAMDLMQEAMRSTYSLENGNGSLSIANVLKFNIGRLYQAAGRLKEAKEMFEAIVQDYPNAVDCFIGLAEICRARGQIKEAIEWAEKVLERKGGHADALALLGNLHLDRRDYPAAQKYFEQLIQNKESKNDPYGMIGLGNLYLYTIPGEAKKKEQIEKREKNLKRAQDLFKVVLSKDPQNIYAANGLGAVLAERGKLEGAKDIFAMVQETAAASGGFLRLPDMWINLGNIHLARGETVSAIKMYETANSKFFNNKNTTILLYLARAFYDEDNLQDARKTLLKAIHLAPGDFKLRFNVALTIQQESVKKLKDLQEVKGTHEEMEMIKTIGKMLVQAAGQFQSLRQLTKDKTGIEEQKLLLHIKFCGETYKKCDKYLETAKFENQKRELQMAKQRAQLEAIHLAPGDFKLRFNVALTIQQESVKKLKDLQEVKGTHEEMEMIKTIGKMLVQAAGQFQSLRQLTKDKTGIEEQKLLLHIKFCGETYKKCDKYLETAKFENQKRELQMAKQRAQLEAAKMKKKLEQERIREEENRKKRINDQRSREYTQRLENLKMAWGTVGRGSSAGTKKSNTTPSSNNKKRKKQVVEDDFITDTVEYDNGPGLPDEDQFDNEDRAKRSRIEEDVGFDEMGGEVEEEPVEEEEEFIQEQGGAGVDELFDDDDDDD